MERFEIGDVLPLTDEEGVSTEFEVIGTTDDNGVQYLALIDTSVEEPEEYVILKVVEEDGETLLVTVDDDDECDDIADYFDDLFSRETDYDA